MDHRHEKILIITVFVFMVVMAVIIRSESQLAAENYAAMGKEYVITLEGPPGKMGIVPASLGITGFPLGGRTFPLDADPVFMASLENLFGQSIFFFDSNGEKTLTWTFPEFGGIEGLAVYLVVVIFDPTLPFPASIVSFTAPHKAVLYRNVNVKNCAELEAATANPFTHITLTQSFTAAGTCTTIQSDNIAIDAKGFTITGSAASKRSRIIDVVKIYENNPGFNFNTLIVNDLGFDLNGKNDIVVKNLELKGFQYGIYDGKGASNIKIEKLHITLSTGSGITIIGGNNINIFGNIVNWNDLDGITFVSSIGSSVKGNHIEANKRYGIELINSDNNKIVENSVLYNGVFYKKFGIELISGSDGNKIYHNNFITNQNQASDNGINDWDSGYPSGGNYWDDYDTVGEGCEDLNFDGFCDSPYMISGGFGEDVYPFVKQIVSESQNQVY